ncbi:MAG: Gfo/Idh/MocA family protein [Candidatus Heimdallarchaeaceae archaeon]
MKLGIVGLGNWGKRVANEAISLLNEGLIEDLFLCDVEPNVLNDYREYNTTPNFDKLLSEVDCVHICTQNQTHYPLGLKALKHNVHTLIEKPFTIDRFNAYELLELSLEKGLILQVGHIFRFANVVKEIKKLIISKEIGYINHIYLEWTHFMKPMTNTDVFWDLAPHPLDVLNFITSRWPNNILSFSQSKQSHKHDYFAFLTAFFNDDMLARIHISWVNPIKRRRVEVVGTEKTIVAECVKQTLEIYEKDGSKSKLNINANNTIRDELLNFLNSINSGKNPGNSGIIGLRTVELIEQAKMNKVIK